MCDDVTSSQWGAVWSLITPDVISQTESGSRSGFTKTRKSAFSGAPVELILLPAVGHNLPYTPPKGLINSIPQTQKSYRKKHRRVSLFCIGGLFAYK